MRAERNVPAAVTAIDWQAMMTPIQVWTSGAGVLEVKA
jgi:hypothetical protein